MLFGIHQTLAIMTGAADLALDEDEAKRLAKSFTDMQRHYGAAGVVSPKTADTVRFCMVAGTIYGSRVMAIRQDRIAARVQKPASAPVKPGPVQTPNGFVAPVDTDGFVGIQSYEPFR